MMKNLDLTPVQGCVRRLGIGFGKKAAVILCSFGLIAGLLAPTALRAGAGTAITQMEYLQWMVQLSGDTGQFAPGATAADYVSWAAARAMVPTGGWQPAAILSRDVLAQTLVQFYNLKASKGNDDLRTLLREGIQLPGAENITRESFVSLVDDFGFQSRTATVSKAKKSKHKTPTKKPTPKKPTKQKTPKKQK